LKIAIIGGSIAGCALALFLKDKYEVIVFEKSNNLRSRGAGITISPQLLDDLFTKDILDSNITIYPAQRRTFYYKSPNEHYGIPFWNQDISILGLHWETLFTNLRKRIPDQIYHSGAKIINASIKDNKTASLTLENGETRHFDLILFADGSHSLGRKIISEHSKLSYSGYVAWRGVLNFDSIGEKTHFTDNIPNYCFDSGHLLAYPIHQNGVKKLNWVLYEKLSEEQLEGLENTFQFNISDKAKKHLYRLAEAKLPPKIAQIILATPSPFMQKIKDVRVHKLVTDRALLLGDASIILRPHVGNGASLAIEDALSLSEHLANYDAPQKAIERWEEHTLPKRLNTYALSERMADALVMNPVSWQEMSPSKMDIWWQQILLGEKWYELSKPQPIN